MTAIAVLGANGRVSCEVAKVFHAAGYDVIAVTRGGQSENLAPAIERRSADALDVEALIRATKGADIVFNGLNPIYTDWSEKVVPMAKNVVAAARAHGATHLFMGNVYNYGREIPSVVDASTPFSASTEKARLRIEMERVFEDAARHGVQTIVLRAGDFYGGPKKGSWFDQAIIAKIGKGVVTYPGPTDLPHAWAYLPDLSAAWLALAEKRDILAPFESFTFEGHTLTGAEMRSHIEAALGRDLKMAGIPWGVLRLGGFFKPMWRELATMSYLWFRPHRLSSARLESVTGTLQTTPPARAVAQALADQGVGMVCDAELRHAPASTEAMGFS